MVMESNAKFIVPNTVADVSLESRGEQAVKRMRKSMLALEPGQLRPLNIDIPLAVSRALGILPAVMALSERAHAECPGADFKAIEELEDRALALMVIHGEFETIFASPPSFQAVVDEAFESRAGLLTVLRMLVALNYIQPENISSLNGGHGYRDVAEDLISIVGLLRRNWATLEGKIPVTPALLVRFHALGENVLGMVGVREQTPAKADSIADLRLRAFTLLDNAYDEVRRAVTFLRWNEGDADDMAPPLRVRKGRTADKPEDEPAKVIVAPKNEPVIVDGKPLEHVVVPATPAIPTGPAPSGLPRNQPFTA